jgi:predicted amidophosphoribosyltransferase
MVLAALIDLVLPTECASCGTAPAPRGVCPACAPVLGGPVRPARPVPAPDGLPPCVTAGEYAGPLRELILAYKEKGRRSLAGPLGETLAAVVRPGLASRSPVVLVPVPATAAAIRARQGDHMWRLAHRAARRLRSQGRAVRLAAPLRALPRADSAHLDRAARERAARHAFKVRPRRLEPLRCGVPVVLLDDVLTTGSTLAAAATRLAEQGVSVAFAATLAATRLRGLGWPGAQGPRFGDGGDVEVRKS